MTQQSNQTIFKKWLWVGYPVVVALMIVWTVQFMVTGGSDIWVNMTQNEEETRKQEELVAILRQKLKILQGVNREELESDLRLAVEAVPPVQKAWQVVTQLRVAALESGSVMKSFKGAGGETKEASESARIDETKPPLGFNAVFTVNDLTQAQRVINSLEGKLPLIRVNSIKYLLGEMDIEVTGTWVGWTKLPEQAYSLPLPEYRIASGRMRTLLAGLVSVGDVSGEFTASGAGQMANPF
ncbi:MAG: hypothetical protein UX91_C0005G0010 [Candidatus Amesbacteria bacterium GW2011_GWB1_47_19]|nr:MAG: hypothetical protein UW51_C0007G0010 [Candidatus Amesbacteria bacterium GW2011_GWA1_44_24]KKU31092.1 MAG: hypothetical protein UX46_C0007G0010 [Candidatus Amesbacteria bacterium GW2011_GWC1_46_24]KKU67213.1 MAG: hypothetical protein UX91_C0005G0010 [Candidatus Amesbacteria bacterium GW2011_GWB1_47_19]OGD05773.1 MAG: hypothetical protein A2379_01450 [Candidatus Amesbacteria bacterium RIFOXYB1_FULL_47_13]HBC72629.1 hypothetical protein [Candidatus Amesbacteria bacterium]